MGISERKERERQEMRKSIIDAAMHIFMKEGYESASIRKIADRIEYSPATIYLYYKDKDELLYDVQAECFSKLVAEFSLSITSEHPFVRLQQLCRSYITFGLENPEMYNLMFIMQAPMRRLESDVMWGNANEAFGMLLQIIDICIQQQLLNFDSTQMAAMSIWSMGHGLVSLNISHRMKVMGMSKEQVAEHIYTAIDRYLETVKV